MAAIIAMIEIIGKFSTIIGKPVKWVKNKNEDHELLIKTSNGLDELCKNHDESVAQSIKHDHDLRDNLEKISQSVSSMVVKLDKMDTKNSLNETATREVLGDRINEKYKYYLKIKGIPEDEVDEFANLHAAYKGVGGNHTGDAKYNYCINNLAIIPVEVELKFDE